MSSNTKTTQPPHSVSSILRARGFVPLPRLWVKVEDLLKIKSIALQYADEVNGVRKTVAETVSQENSTKFKDPKTDRNAAWEAVEKS